MTFGPSCCTTMDADTVCAGMASSTLAYAATWRSASCSVGSTLSSSSTLSALVTKRANDANTEAAAGYGVVNLRATHRFLRAADGRVDLLVRVDNLFGRNYAGSVIVNESNARYFEPGAPRSLFLGLRWTGSP